MPARIFPKQFEYLQHTKPFLISLCVILSLILSSVFIALYSRTDQLILKRIRAQAVDYIDLVNHVKTWNFDYGGVYVEKRPGVESNIYLRKLGMNPDLKAEGGKSLTIRNHAIMTTEVSRISEQHDGIRFRIVSLRPVDPENAPDGFETAALQTFETKRTSEAYSITQTGPQPLFRYLVPLYVDKTCLECHSSQGYAVGSVIGAISVSIPIEAVLREQRTNKVLIIGGAVSTICLLIGLCYFLTVRLVAKLDEAQLHLKKQAATDELTGLRNRRKIMSRLEEEFLRGNRLGEPPCLIILDIDHFKRINDTYGHHFGDIVLKEIARRMQEGLRKYDIIGRIGGEEFLVIAPSTSTEDGITLAERLRAVVSESAVSEGEISINVTISAGVAIADDPDDTVESALRRADNALYKAKREGRNRVAML